MTRPNRIRLVCVALFLLASVTRVDAQTAIDGGSSNLVFLFDGKTLNGWTTLSGEPVPEGWEVVNGELHLSLDSQRPGPIVTSREYTNFELMFEWRIAPGGNNGIKYRVRDYDGRVLGTEYQIIDQESRRNPLTPNQRTGAIYGLYEPAPDCFFLRPAGEYNDSRIVVCGRRIEHWLNGQRITTATVGSDAWMKRVANSKFANADGFGQYPTGKIMLTDHNSEVWFRYIVLRPL